MNQTDQADSSVKQSAVEAFREKLRLWTQCLAEDPVHSIRQQVTQMVWQDATFRVLDLARKPADGQIVSANNSLLGHFLDEGYVATQVLAISRLVDRNMKRARGGKDKNADYSVNSLRELVDDVRSFRERLTRGVFAGIDQEPYDQLDGSHPGHAIFDEISYKSFENRSPDDLIAIEFLDRLTALLGSSSINAITAVRDKFLAHPANDPSMEGKTSREKYISFEVVDRAHRDILAVFSALYHIFYRTVWGEIVPVYQGGKFNGLDQPYARAEMIKAMGEAWHLYSKQRGNLCNDWRKMIFGDGTR